MSVFGTMDTLNQENNEVYEQQLPVIIAEAKKAHLANVIPIKGHLDYIQDGCQAVLDILRRGDDVRFARMEISRAMRQPWP